MINLEEYNFDENPDIEIRKMDNKSESFDKINSDKRVSIKQIKKDDLDLLTLKKKHSWLAYSLITNYYHIFLNKKID